MKRIELLKMHIQNFKGCKKNDIHFSKKTFLKGTNATGKSTVFDAWMWVLFGYNSLGDSKFSIRPLDEFGDFANDDDIIVETTILISDGINTREIQIDKIQRKKDVTKRGETEAKYAGNENTYLVDGSPKKEREYKEFIKSIVDEKLFKLVTDPNAFFSLPWKERREIVMKLGVKCSDAEIAITFGDRFQLIIPELKEHSTEDIIKKYRYKKSKLEEQKSEIKPKIEELHYSVISTDIGALEVEKSAKYAALKKVEDELSGGADTLEKINDLRQQVIEEKFKLSGLQNDANAELDDKRREARRKVDDADKKVMETERELSDVEYMKQDYIKVRDRAESDKSQYGTEWKAWKAKTYPEYVPLAGYGEPLPLTEKDMICPTCGQELPEEVKKQRIADHGKLCAKAKADYDAKCKEHRTEYEMKKAAFSKEREKHMKEITVKGQKAADDVRAYQKRIDEQEKEISALKLRLECEKADLSKAKKNLADIPGSVDISGDEKYIQIQMTIQGLENEIAALSKDTSGRTELEAKKAVLQDEISDIEAQIKATDNTKVKERIAELEEEQKSIGQKIAEQEQMIDLTESFIRAKMNMISEKINGRFGGKVTFKLFDTQINQGIKETCKCEWNGKSDMSNGESIVAGLYIIKALSSLYEVSCPVFVDNSEAISEGNFPDMDSQVIELRVSNDKELIVSC